MNGYWCIFALGCLVALVAIVRAILAYRKALKMPPAARSRNAPASKPPMDHLPPAAGEAS